MPRILVLVNFKEGFDIPETENVASMSDLDILIQEKVREEQDTNSVLPRDQANSIDFFVECVHTETGRRSFEHIKTESL